MFTAGLSPFFNGNQLAFPSTLALTPCAIMPSSSCAMDDGSEGCSFTQTTINTKVIRYFMLLHNIQRFFRKVNDMQMKILEEDGTGMAIGNLEDTHREDRQD